MRVSVLGYAVLGLLAEGSMSGYDLKLKMGESVGYFWQASHSQIYPELSRLEAAGFVSHSVVEQEGRPDKKVYEVTESGFGALGEWLRIPPKITPTRDEETLKAYLSWIGDTEEIRENFRDQAEIHERQLRRYEQIEDWMRESEEGDIPDPAGLDPRRFARYAAIRRGIGFERANADWCAWVAENLPRSPEDRM